MESNGAAAPPPAGGSPVPPHAAQPAPSGSSDDALALELEAELGRGGSSPLASGGGVDADADADAAPATKRARQGNGDGGAPPPPPPTSSVCPPHPASMGGICVRCGAAVPQEEVESGVALRYIHGGLRLSESEAARLRAASTTASTSAGRLHLVLDLDHTLLNSTRIGEVPPALRPDLDAAFAAEAAAVAAARGEVEGGGGVAAARAAPADPRLLGRDGASAAAAMATTTMAPAVPTDPRRRRRQTPDAGMPTATAAAPTDPRRPPPEAATAPADPRRRDAAAAAGAAAAATPTSNPTHPHPLQTLFTFPDIGMVTKLRPGLRAFLASAHERYELVVYTHGDRSYAHAMARLLDPDGSLFGGRVISQNDSTVAHAKSLDVVLGQADATLILDDTAGVWPGHAANLIQVERYIFFPADAGRFGTGRPALLEEGRDEVPDSGTLAAVGRVLASVHDRVFGKKVGGGVGTATTTTTTTTPRTKDVRVHLAAERATILAGCILVLSGCAPLGVDPAASPVGGAALSLGARLRTSVEAGVTTHVVAAADGTAKCVAGREAGVPVVGPDWVFSALFLWARAEEAGFPPPPPAPPGGRGGPPPPVDDVAAAAAAAGGGGPARRPPPPTAHPHQQHPHHGLDDRDAHIEGVL